MHEHDPHSCQHSLQCILPPHMVDSIRMRGDKKQRKMCDEMEKMSEAAREARQAMAPPKAFLGAPVMAEGDSAEARQEIYDGQTRNTLPGRLVRSTGDDPVDDAAVNSAFDGAAATHDFLRDVYRRNSLDGNGLKLVSTVHHMRDFNNAFWNGEQMAYGDGDGVVFQNLAGGLSVIGHELSHGLVQFSGGLMYRDQSGALNESFADVFGALVVQYQNRQTAAEADWLIGSEILGPEINGVALRSLKAPGTAYDDPLLGQDPQPYHQDFFINTTSDNGGVHLNSGIPNHAFYLLAQYLGGFAWEKAGQIWYDTLQQIQNPFATFAQWADKTLEVARGLYGNGSLEATFTRRAWKLVGIDV